MAFPAEFTNLNLKLPSPPTVLSRLLRMLAEDRSSAADLADVILEDPGLTARVLRVANSPFYNFSNKIETVSHAIALLGCRTIRILCASESFLAIFPRRKGNFAALFLNYCRHSLATALLAKIMAEEMSLPIDSEKVFIAGLLHDIGKPVLWYNFLEEGGTYHELIGRGLSEREAEILAYGADHTEIGAWVAGEWGLDSDLAKTMAHHHHELHKAEVSKTPGDYSLTEIITYADVLSKCLEDENGQPVFASSAERFVQHRIPCLDWSGVTLLFADQAPLYDIDTGANEPVIVGHSKKEPTAESVNNDYDELLQRSLSLFKAYNSFLDHFNLTDIFAGIRENLYRLSGIEAVYILVYKSKEQSLNVQTAVGPETDACIGKRLLLNRDELKDLEHNRENDTALFFNRRTPENNPLAFRLARLFLTRGPAQRAGLFLPVYGEHTLLGAFCLELTEDKVADDPIFQELLLGHAVQLALAIRFYHLTRKLQLLKTGDSQTTSTLVLGQALKVPLRTLRENIYLLDQEGKNAAFNRSGYRHIYCQKIRQALDEISGLVSRYGASAPVVADNDSRARNLAV